MNDRTVRAFRSSLEIRGLDDGGRTVVGIAAPFNSPTEIDEGWAGSFRETIQPGTFLRTISERGPNKVKALYGHQWDQPPIGRAVELQEVTRGLWTALRLSSTPRADEALALVRDGVIDSFSIGFVVPPGGDRWNRDRTQRDITEAKLYEVSLVPFPAYEDALISAVRHANPPSSRPGFPYWEARLRAFESEF